MFLSNSGIPGANVGRGAGDLVTIGVGVAGSDAAGVADAVGSTGAVADGVAVGVAVGVALFTVSGVGVATFFFFMPVTVTLTFPNVLFFFLPFFFLPFFRTSFTVIVAFPAFIPVTFPFDVTFATCLLLLVKE